MREALQRAWLRRGALACLLWPVSLLFGALAALRRAAYRLGILHSERIPVPVVVVGNVVAGGAGKTPVVMAIVDHLRTRGHAVGVVSRGYGRQSSACLEVVPGSDPRDTGDEPLLIATSTRAPVFVAGSRSQAALALLNAYPATQVIVCDDGLQHHALGRDIEICVFDERGVGNGWLLPAGPLREHWPRSVDLVLRDPAASGIEGFDVQRRLAMQARRADGSTAPLSAFKVKPVTAIAGIAKPEAFFAMLRQAGVELSRSIALPDHDDFDALPVDSGGHELICTEKDAVKLWRRHPQAWAVPLEVTIAAEFWQALDSLLAAKLSSPHGSQTA
jgi:tetraacyldisaccharide 4'-kinase